LTARLDDPGLQRLVMVIAPAGSGKSTLLSEWCHSALTRGARVAWLSLDPGDNDPARFVLYLIAALNRVAPDLGETARALLSSSQRPPLDVVLTTLSNDLAALEGEFTLVLDDYHTILADAVHELMTSLLEHAPPGLRVVIGSRADPPLPLSRWRVRGQLVELRAGDLRFTQEEAAAFLNEVMGLTLEPEAVARLEARTEGWIAGLQLAALSLQGRADAAGFLNQFTGSHRYVADYLFDEVLSRQPEPVQQFLVRTSILERLCGPLCDAVTGRSGSQALLEQLESANLFLIPLDEQRRWYRYHHLFAEVLRARLQQEGESMADLHGRAAAWYEQQELMEEAVQHALSGSHLDQASRLIERHGAEWWIRGERHTLEHCLKALPEEMIRSRPVLTILQAVVYLYLHQTGPMEEILSSGRFAEPVDTGETRDVHGALLVLRGYLTRLQGKTDRALEHTRGALAHLSPGNRVWRRATYLNLGFLQYAKGQLQEADESFTEVITGYSPANDFHVMLAAATTRGQIREARGALREAEQLYQSELRFAAEQKALLFPETAVLFAALGRLRYQSNDLAGAEAHLAEGLKCQHPVFALTCLIELLRVRNARRDREGITAVLARMEAMAQSSGTPWLPPTLVTLRVRMGLARDEEARAWLEWYEAQDRSQVVLRLPLFGIGDLEALAWAQLCRASGRSAEVLLRLEERLETAVQQGRHGHAMEMRAFLAALQQEEGRGDRAVALLEPALTLAATEGYRRVFLDAGPSLVPVLRHAAARGIAPDTVGELLSAFREEGLLAVLPPVTETPLLPQPLSERELEVLRLVAAGLSNAEIANQLFLSLGTVKRHVSNLSGKLDAANRTGAVARARALGLL
jgi:LuxR family maltose regulon positive regulatory protein